MEDPSLRFTSQGQPVARFRVASVPRYLDKTTNEWKDGEGLFLTVNVWRQPSLSGLTDGTSNWNGQILRAAGCVS